MCMCTMEKLNYVTVEASYEQKKKKKDVIL